jgi:hypothetical protein
MFAFLTPVDGVKTDPLVDAQTAERFWQSLPRRDPVMSQKVMSDALADLTTAGHPTAGHICALLMLGKRTRKLTEALLINYGEMVPKLQPLERKYWQAAFELSQSFRHCFLELVRCCRDGASIRDWEEYAPLVLLRYFQHRQVESLLRPFVGPKPRLIYSSEVHEVYTYARAQGLAAKPVVVRRFHEQSSTPSTLEREYIHVLLLKLMRSAQLAPHEAFWVNQQLPRWCEALLLRPSGPGQAGADRTGCFIVAPDDPEGLVRAEANDANACLSLDPSPMLACIHDEIARLREAGDRAPSASSATDRQLKVLRKVCIVFSPLQERIRRRGERRFVASTIEVAMGLAQIVRALRQEQRLAAAAGSACVPEVEEITITEYGAYTEMRPAGPCGNGDTALGAPAGDICVSYDVWQLKDRSDSGCRLHGQITDGKTLLPGTLLAFREGGAGPWTVAVVRRSRLLIGNHVEIGIEFVGRDPRLVKMVARDPAHSWSASPNKANRSFAALYLPGSTRHPVMPIKTVILPARGFASGVCLTLTAAAAEYTVRLKEPIEEQAEFSWLPCEVVEQYAAEQAA